MIQAEPGPVFSAANLMHLSPMGVTDTWSLLGLGIETLSYLGPPESLEDRSFRPRTCGDWG